jgi:hypothetical protein
MTERVKEGKETSEQMTQELFEFVNKADFDSPQFRAISDCVALNDLYSRIEKISDQIKQNDKNRPETSYEAESRLRISEFEMGLLSNQIYQNKTTIRGYQKAYAYVSSTINGITEQILDEPENSKKYEGDGAKIYNHLFAEVKDIIDKKRGES